MQNVGGLSVTVFRDNLPHQKYQESALRAKIKIQTLLPFCCSEFLCQAGEGGEVEVGSCWKPGWLWGIQGKGVIGTLSALGR